MSKKRALVILLISILMFNFVIAQSNQSNETSSSSQSGNVIDKAYQCLETQISNKAQAELSLQEAVFGTLALGSKSKLTSVIDGKAISGERWAESSNSIKDTSQVLLAYNRIGKNTDNIESWVLTNEQPAQDITWHLQIDTETKASSCDISYDDGTNTITISEDQTISGNAGSCLTSSGYWLRVEGSCAEKTFTVSCDEDFTTSLLYQRTGSSRLFLSPSTHSSASSGTTQETINSKCFSETSSCDYEGTLWAALALDSLGIDVSMYLPYLQALSTNNVKFLPSSFLHKLTTGSSQYSELVSLQQQSKFWQAPNTPNNKFFDSALAMLSLQGTSSTEFSSSQAYFEGIVTPEGCWNNNNLRDTAFLLYSGWPRTVSTSSGTPSTPSCTSQGYSCTSALTCSTLNGTISDNSCLQGVCCSESPQEQTCAELGGTSCSASETCSGTSASSSDGSCCLATCDELPSANECETEGGSCYSSCNDDEDLKSYSCDGSDVCCFSEDSEDSGSSIITWIIVLSILILLIVLAIVFRDKIKLALFKRKSGGAPAPSRGIPPGRRPPFPPRRGPIPMRGSRPIRRAPAMPQRRQASKTDKELDDTMRKLKEMSK